MFLVIMLPLVFLRDAIEIPYISRDMLLLFAVLAVIATLLGTYILQTKYMRQFVYNLAQRFKAHKTKDWLSKLETLNQGLGLLYKEPIQSIIVFFESGLSFIMLVLYCTSINVRFYTRYSYHRYFRSHDSIKSYFIFCSNSRGNRDCRRTICSIV